MKSRFSSPLLFLAFCLFVTAGRTPVKADIAIQNAQKLAFLGDSITQFGADNPGGYVRLIIKGLEANGVKVEPIPAGTSGDRTVEMLARLDKVLAKKPDWITISAGVNDVNGGKNVSVVPIDQYKTNLTALVDRCQAAGAHVLLLTLTPIREELDNEKNANMVAYNAFIHELAKQKNCLLAEVNADFQAIIKASPKPGRVLLIDGLHMNQNGDEVMATAVLRGFGLDDAQLQTARAAWNTIPDRWWLRFAYYGSTKPKSLYLWLPLTRSRHEALKAIAIQSPKNSSVSEFLRPIFDADVKSLLKPEGEYDNLDAIFDAGKDKEVLAQLEAKMSKQVDDLIQY